MKSREWKEAVLGDVCEYYKGRIDMDDVSVENYISTENMVPERGGVTSASTLPNAKSVIAYSIGDTLISNIRPYFKKIWYADKNGGASNDVLVLRCNKDKVDNGYLYYYLSQNSFFKYVMGSSKGTKMPRGDKEAILKYNIKYPSLGEQKTIVNILSVIDAKMQLNTKINENLQSLCQRLFKQWFVDFEFLNEEGLPYKSSGGEMFNSELGIIPKGWEVSALCTIADIVMGQSPSGSSYNEDGIGTIFYQGRTDFGERFPIKRLYTTEPKRMAKLGETLMSVRAPVGDINIAYEDCCIGRGLCSIKSNNNYTSYIYYVMMSLKDKLNVYNGEGTVFGSINKDTLANLNIVKPMDSIIEMFNKIAFTLDRKYLCLVKENRELILVRDTLLLKLMNGEIDISNLEIDF